MSRNCVRGFLHKSVFPSARRCRFVPLGHTPVSDLLGCGPFLRQHVAACEYSEGGLSVPPLPSYMRRAALIYNPVSGLHGNHRHGWIDSALELLRKAGIKGQAIATTAPGSAAALVREAVESGCDAILACGGDGTVHEVLQPLVGTPVALGVLPLGTANALAADLGLPMSPLKALERMITAVPERIPVGRITYTGRDGATESRYFTVAAGIGADALLMYRLDAQLKRRFGYALYAVQGLRVLATNPFPLFDATFAGVERRQISLYRRAGQPVPRSVSRNEAVSQLLAVRIRNFGGMLQDFAPGATLRRDTLRLIAFKTQNRFAYVRFLAAVIGRRHAFRGRIELLDAQTVECRVHKGVQDRVYVEADGEILGALPARIEIVPDALTMLIPPEAEL